MGRSISSRQQLIRSVSTIALCFVVCLPLIARIMAMDIMATHDGAGYVFRTLALDINFHQGRPFFGWASDLNLGYGSPGPSFYSPLPQAGIEILHLLGADYIPAAKAYMIITLLIAWLGMYFLLRNSFSASVASVGAAAYVYAPLLLFDIFRRAGIPQVSTMALWPWSLAFAERTMRTGERRLAFALTISAAGLLLTHHPTSPLAFASLVVYAAAIYVDAKRDSQSTNRQEPNGRTIRLILAALGLAFALSAFFWIPLLYELRYLQFQRSVNQFPLDLPDLWITAQTIVQLPPLPVDIHQINPQNYHGLGPLQLLLAGVSLIHLLARWRKPNFYRSAFFELMLILSLLLGSPLARYLWDHTAIHFLQQPFRLFVPATLAVGYLAGYAIHSVAANRLWFQEIGAAILIPLFMIQGLPWSYSSEQVGQTSVIDLPALARRMNPDAGWFATEAGEFLPIWVSEFPDTSNRSEAYIRGESIQRLGLGSAPSEAVIEDLRDEPGKAQVVINSPTEFELLYHTFYFPGWQAIIDGREVSIRITPNTGLIAVSIPPGRHTLQLEFTATPIRVTSSAFSLAALGLLLWFLIRETLKQMKSGKSTQVDSSSPSFELPLWNAWGAGLPLVTALATVGLIFGVTDRVNNPIRATRRQPAGFVGVQHPVRINFENEIMLEGYDLALRSLDTDRQLAVVMYWSPLHKLGVPYGFGLRLVDSDGIIWATVRRPRFFIGGVPSEQWSETGFYRDELLLDLFPGTPPGHYWLEAEVFRRDIAANLIHHGSFEGPEPAWARVDQIHIGSQALNAVGITPAMENAVNLPVNDAAILVGWTLHQPKEATSGDVLLFEALWQAKVNQPNIDPGLLRWRDSFGQTWDASVWMPGGQHYPPNDWQINQIVRDQIRLVVPPQLPSGLYTLEAEPGDQTITFANVQVNAPERHFSLPLIETPTDVTWDSLARLVGYSIHRSATGNTEPIHVELVWEVLGTANTSLRSFVHLQNDAGALIAQDDSIPVGWTRPTTGWLAGEYIVDDHMLSLPADIQLGTYRLFMGVYDPVTRQRIMTPEGDYVFLTSIEVK